MKPLDELRNISEGCAYNEDDCRQWRSCREHRAQLLDAIETEIAERYQPLPKDADGEYIHIGDVMEWASYDEDLTPVIRTVDAVGERAFFAWNEEGGRYAQYETRAFRHYHAPTVEDVLREFANEVYADADSDIRDRDFLCAKYAKRLKLAGGEGE